MNGNHSVNNDSFASDSNLLYVSFSDEEDLSTLLSEQDVIHGLDNICDVPAFEIGNKQESRSGDGPNPQAEMSESSRPTQVSESFQQRAVYGSLEAERLDSSRRLIYCVHGKLSGCCVVTDNEIIERHTDTAIHAEQHQHGRDLFNGEDHCHWKRNEEIDKTARRKLIIASILCVLFIIGEVIGGYLSSSLAIATDAAHLLTDFASFMISLFSLWVASRPPTRKMSFGWYRAEVIGALTSVLMIWVVTVILVYMAVLRLINRDFEINATIMLITSAVGVLVNLVMGLTLHQHGHSHGSGGAPHAHNHEHSPSNINVRAAYIHVIGDLIQSVGVLVASLIIYFKPTWDIVDPICTFLFSLLVLATTCAIVRDTVMVLMEAKPKGVDFSAVMNTFLQIDGVIRVHNLRIWALSLDKTALSAHLAIRPGIDPQNVLRMATRNIHERFHFFEMTLQIEEFNQNMEDCTQCQAPET